MTQIPGCAIPAEKRKIQMMLSSRIEELNSDIKITEEVLNQMKAELLTNRVALALVNRD
jgi:lipid A disaccharide synthetase